MEQYFVHNQNATQAAIAAGYAPNSAGQTGFQLLKNPQILAAIEKRREEIAKESEFTAEEVIRGLARAYRFDPAKLYYQDGPNKGKMKPVYELDDDTRLEIEGFDIDSIVKVVTTGTGKNKKTEVITTPKIKYDLPKKSTARDQAMKFFGLFAKDKQGFDPEEDKAPPPPIPVTIDFKDARRRKG